MAQIGRCRLIPLALGSVALLAGCQGGSEDLVQPEPAPTDSAIECDATKPNGNAPPGEAPGRYYGNGKLWTVLPPDGVVRPDRSMVQPNGTIRVKFPWWRAVEGLLTISGRRLDAEGRALAADVPSGYGVTGFQATSILFPTAGCWSVTGRVASASLRFVVAVREARDVS